MSLPEFQCDQRPKYAGSHPTLLSGKKDPGQYARQQLLLVTH